MWDLNFGTWISHRGLHSGLRPRAPTSVDKNPKMKDLAIVVMWVQALVHLILKGCGWQVIDGGKLKMLEFLNSETMI
jgi:hypothetical protein